MHEMCHARTDHQQVPDRTFMPGALAVQPKSSRANILQSWFWNKEGLDAIKLDRVRKSKVAQ